MSWSIVVVAARTTDVDKIVPDVLRPTGETLTFEDAVSPARNQGMSTTTIGPWGVVFDVGGRLSGAPHHLAEASAGTDLHLVRIAFDPAIMDFHDGSRLREVTSRQACFELTPNHQDGEACAIELLRQRTGIRFPDDLADATFRRRSWPDRPRRPHCHRRTGRVQGPRKREPPQITHASSQRAETGRMK